MNRRSTLGVLAIATALMLPLSSQAQQPAPAAPQPKGPPPAAAPAAPPKPMKEAIVGSWSLLIDDAVKADGTHQPNFGPNPEGIAIFSADGHFVVANFVTCVEQEQRNHHRLQQIHQWRSAYLRTDPAHGLAHLRRHLSEPGRHNAEAHHHLADRGR